MLPPVTVELGSIAKRAILKFLFPTYLPKASMNVLLPTPGLPVMPILNAVLLGLGMDFSALYITS